MMAIVENQAHNIAPARRGEIAVYTLSTATKWHSLNATVTPLGASVGVKNYWRKRYITLQADGGDIYYCFTDDNATAIDPTSSPDGIGTATCALVSSGTEKHILVPGVTDTALLYLALISASGTPKARLWVSSPKFTLCGALMGKTEG